MRSTEETEQRDERKPELPANYLMYGAFGLGLAAALAVRAIIIVNHIQPDWVRPVWYFAVLGNFVFFLYRFHVSSKRKRAVKAYQLLEKLDADTPLTATDRDVLLYLLRSIDRSPENINYLVIFAFSLVAIAGDLVLSFINLT